VIFASLKEIWLHHDASLLGVLFPGEKTFQIVLYCAVESRETWYSYAIVGSSAVVNRNVFDTLMKIFVLLVHPRLVSSPSERSSSDCGLRWLECC
jgi:hypothetical protein